MNQTRREIIKAGAGLAAILAAGQAPAVFTKSLIGARNGGLIADGASDGMGWCPYVTDGLIAMWDGEWNVAPKTHDEATPIWKDLIGDNDIILGDGHSEVGDNKIIFSNLTYNSPCGSLSMPINGLMGVELCAVVTGSAAAIIRFDYSYWKQLWHVGSYRTIGGGYSNAGYNGVSRSLFTVYGDGEDNKNFNLRALNGIMETPTGYVFGFGPAGSKIGFGWRDPGYPFSGEVYSMRIYNRPLLENEVAHNCAVDTERFGLP